MYTMHTGPKGCTMLALWPDKYKVGHIDLILIKHQNLLNSLEIPEFLCVSHMQCIKITIYFSYFLKSICNVLKLTLWPVF